MKRLTSLALAMAVLCTGLWLACSGLTLAMTGNGPGGFLQALYAACSVLVGSAWAADVVRPVGVEHG
jgi:hypothetical protein